MPLATELAELYRRDLTRLLQELDAFPDDETLWRTTPGMTNSAGNLMLHLEGNLREYIGRLIGGVAYSRNRPLEFSDRGITRAALHARLTEVRDLVSAAIARLTPEQLDAPFPDPVLGVPATVAQVLVGLYGHLSYHKGQIDVLRRALTAGSATPFAPLADFRQRT